MQCARIHTIIGLNDRQLLWKANTCTENCVVFHIRYYYVPWTFWNKEQRFAPLITVKNRQLSTAPLKVDCAGPRSAVGNVSGYRCVSDCRSRGREFDPGQVPYFPGDWLWNDFYGHSPPFRWFIQEGLLSVTSESICTNYWLTACSSLPRKKCG